MDLRRLNAFAGQLLPSRELAECEASGPPKNRTDHSDTRMTQDSRAA